MVQKNALFFGFVFLVAMVSDAHSAQWELVPSVNVNLEYDDNRTLSTIEKNKGQGFNFLPALTLSRRTKISELGVRARAQFTDYLNSDVPDNDVQFLDLFSRYRTLRSRLGLNGVYRRDTTLATLQVVDVTGGDQVATDTDNVEETDVGLVQTKVRRNRLTLRPSWDYQLTQKIRVGLGYNYTGLFYSDVEGTGLREFNQHGVNVNLASTLTERRSLVFTVSGSTFQPKGGTDSRNYTFTVSSEYEFTPTLDSQFSAGVRRTETASNDSTGYLANLRLQTRTERTNYRIVLLREINPSGAGLLVQHDQLDVGLRKRITERTNFRLGFKVFRNEAINDSSTNVNRTYFYFTPSIQRRMSFWWNLEFRYRYRYQEYDNINDSAESNAFFIIISYRHPNLFGGQ